MSERHWRWVPATILLVGLGLVLGSERSQRAMSLRQNLGESVPSSLLGFHGEDLVISEDEQRVAGMSSYLMRVYGAEGADGGSQPFSLYVGYYEQQVQGKTIHSPKNCLPGSGWEPLVAHREEIATAGGTVPVNRYLIQRGDERALVLYWYQGRGRLAANEYLVKWNLLRDQVLRGRSDEALVRVMIPITETEETAYRLAEQVTRAVVPAVQAALPG